MEKILKSCDLTLNKSVVLASESPRRRELLSQILPTFEVVASNIDENLIHSFLPSKLVKMRAYAKAHSVKETNEVGDKTIISADTVVYRNKVYGKPIDFIDAVEMLTALNGKWHTVFTGVCILSGDTEISFTCRSRVKFKQLTRREIESYIDLKKPFDKAGSYGIQDSQIVAEYTGSYTNIVGLPMEKLTAILIKAGVCDAHDRTFN
ncbi:MAG: Maf family protein [Clostridia bacterium]